MLAGCRPGMILVDMTTSEPSLAREIAAAAAERGAHAVDAPVSGGDVGAREARLSIMVGGDAEAVEALLPCFEAMGKTIVHQGGPGAGQHTKLVNQILIAANMIGVCEALLYAYKAGLELERAAVGRPGAAGSWSLSNLGPRIIANNFEPGFFVEHFIKDMGIALGGAKRMGLALPGLALVPTNCTWPCRRRGTAATARRPCTWRWRGCRISTGRGEKRRGSAKLDNFYIRKWLRRFVVTSGMNILFCCVKSDFPRCLDKAKLQ